jgi:hypothetical protein
MGVGPKSRLMAGIKGSAQVLWGVVDPYLKLMDPRTKVTNILSHTFVMQNFLIGNYWDKKYM